MQTFAAVIEAFGGPAKFARAMGLKPFHAGTMKGRDSIPPEYWPKLVEKASEHGIEGVTFESLARIAAAKRNRDDATGAGVPGVPAE